MYIITVTPYRMKQVSRFKATAPPFIPEQERIQKEKNQIRNKALTIAMQHTPSLIPKIGVTSKSYHPLYQPNLQAPYEDLKDVARVPKLIDIIYGKANRYFGGRNRVKNTPETIAQAKEELVSIICRGVRLNSDIFADLFVLMIRNNNIDLINEILTCDGMRRYAKQYYSHADYFEHGAGKTLYNLLDDTKLDIAEKLYTLGFDINHRSTSKLGMYDTRMFETAVNFTPLEEAIANAQPRLVEFLLNKGANPPTNPASLYRAIVPFGGRLFGVNLSDINQEQIRQREEAINIIYNIPKLKFRTMLNELILIKKIPNLPIVTQTIVKALNYKPAYITINKPYTEMIDRFIRKFQAAGGEAREVIEEYPARSTVTSQNGGSRRTIRRTKRAKRTKRTRKMTKRLK